MTRVGLAALFRRRPSRPSSTFVGADGDGIGAHPDGSRLYVPLTVPGDFVSVRPLARRGDGWAAELECSSLEPGPGRRAPVCEHFGVCGGCTSQHWDGGAITSTGKSAGSPPRCAAPASMSLPLPRSCEARPVRAAGWISPSGAGPVASSLGLHRDARQRHRRSDRMRGAASRAVRADRSVARGAVRSRGAAARGIGRGQSAGQRCGCAAAHRRRP